MKVFYVAGRYRAKTEWELINNIRRAEEAALELWKKGYAVLCPHKNTQNFQGALPDKIWLDGCCELLSRCDAVLMLDGWKQSEGATLEFELANTLGLEIYYDLKDIESVN